MTFQGVIGATVQRGIKYGLSCYDQQHELRHDQEHEVSHIT